MSPSSESIERILADIYQSGGLEDENGARRELAQTAMRREQGEELQRLVREAGARRTIETGFAFGMSGLHMVKGMLDGGCDSPRHFAMDPTEASAWGNAGLEAFKRAEASGFLEFENNGSGLVLPHLVSQEREPFDVALVDGGHLFEHAFLDLFYMRSLVRPGGIVILDDVWMPAVRWALDYCLKNLGASVIGTFGEGHAAPKRRFRKGSRVLRYSEVAHVVLRWPDPALERGWDHFVPFGDLAPE